MKVIDLYNKIANGEEVPYKIKYNERIYEYTEEIKWYLRDDMKCELSNSKKRLNDEVEIPEEPKGIPEKLDVDEEEKGKFIIWSTEFEQCTTLEMKIIKRQDYIIRKINEIIDYLESKGDE